MQTPSEQPTVQTIDLAHELNTIAPHGGIGLVALATDFNVERDFRRMLPEGVEVSGFGARRPLTSRKRTSHGSPPEFQVATSAYEREPAVRRK